MAPNLIPSIVMHAASRRRHRDNTRVLLKAQGLTPTSFRFYFTGLDTALAYMSHVDPDTQLGRLELHFVTGEHFKIDEEVREFREVWWPERWHPVHDRRRAPRHTLRPRRHPVRDHQQHAVGL